MMTKTPRDLSILSFIKRFGWNKKLLSKYVKPLLNVRSFLVLACVVFAVFIVVYFTYLIISWTGVRYDVYLHANNDYIEIIGPTGESSETFSSLQAGDRIVAIDDISVKQLLTDKQARNKILFYPSEGNNPELTLAGNDIGYPYPSGQRVLLFSVRAKSLTFDFSHRQVGLNSVTNPTTTNPTSLPFKDKGNGSCPCQILIERNSTPGNTDNINPLVRVDLTHLQSKNDRILTTLILSFTALFVCFVATFFYILRPSPVTTVLGLFNVTVPIELVASNLFESYIGKFENFVLITSAGLIGIIFLHFIGLFPSRRTLSSRFRFMLIFFYSISFTIILLRNYLVTFGTPSPATYSTEHILRRLDYLFITIPFLTGLFLLVYRYCKVKGQERLRLKLAVLSIACASIIPLFATFYYLVVSLWQPVYYSNFGLFFLSTSIVPPAFGYAVVKNELLGVSLVVRRSVMHIILTLLSVIIFVVLSTVITATVPVWKDISQNPVPNALILAILTVLLYQVFQFKVQYLIDRAFNVYPLDYNKLNQDWTQRLVRMNDLSSIVNQVVKDLPRDYHYTNSAILLCSPVLRLIKNHVPDLVNTATPGPGKFEQIDFDETNVTDSGNEKASTATLVLSGDQLEKSGLAIDNPNFHPVSLPGLDLQKMLDPELHSIASSLRILMSFPMLSNSSSKSQNTREGDSEEKHLLNLTACNLQIKKLTWDFIQRSEYIQIENASLPDEVKADLEPLKSLNYQLAIPLTAGEECYGLLLLGRKTSDYFPTEEELIHLSTTASHIAVAIYNAALLSYAFSLAEAELSLRQIYEYAMNHEEVTREEERLKLSEALHSGILQLLHQLDRNLNQMISDWAAGRSMSVVGVGENPKMLEQVITSLRNINSELMPMHVEKHLVNELRNKFFKYTQDYPTINFKFLVNEQDESLLEKLVAKDLKICLYRVIEEIVTNAIKHSQAKNITATLRLESLLDSLTDQDSPTYQLEVRVVDDGVGLSQAMLTDQGLYNLMQNNHFGLTNLKLRVEGYKGEVKFYSNPGEGLEVICSFLVSSDPVSARISFDEFFRKHLSDISLEV